LNNGFGIFKRTFQNNYLNWEFLNLSEIDYTYDLVAHPSNPDVIYSGYISKPFQDFAVVRKTTDGGDSWNTILEVPGSKGIVTLALDPSDPDILYAGSIGERGKIYRSTDGGSTWSFLNNDFIMCTIWGQAQLVTEPENSSTAYTATWLGGAWKTQDAGNSWTLPEDAPISATAVSINCKNKDIIYLSERSRPSVWKSTDAGQSWNEIADFIVDGAILVMRGKLYKSTNAGIDWSNITNGFPKGILDICVEPVHLNNVYVTTNINGVHKSTDGGTNWSQLVTFPDAGAYDIEIDNLEPSILYAAIRGGSLPSGFTEIAGDRPDGITFSDNAGVYKSTDSGDTWNQILTTGGSCRVIRIHPGNNNVLAAVDILDGLYISTDGGDNWSLENSISDNIIHTSCDFNGDKIYVGTQGCGVYSGDLNKNTGTVTWQSERSNKPVPEVYNLQIEVDPVNSNRIYVSSYPGGLYRSDDGGLTFTDKNGITPSVIAEDPVRQGYYTIAINPANTEEVWLGTWGKGIYKSFDGMSLDIPANGNDMKMLRKHIFQIVIDPNPPHTVYTATEEGVYKTTDGGET